MSDVQHLTTLKPQCACVQQGLQYICSSSLREVRVKQRGLHSSPIACAIIIEWGNLFNSNNMTLYVCVSGKSLTVRIVGERESASKTRATYFSVLAQQQQQSGVVFSDGCALAVLLFRVLLLLSLVILLPLPASRSLQRVVFASAR